MPVPVPVTGTASRVVQVLTQARGGPADHAVDVAVGLAARGLDSHVVGPAGAGAARAQRAGVVWHPVLAASKRDLSGLVRLAWTVLRLRPDVLHLQDRRAGWLGRALAPALRSTRVVYTLHGVPDALSERVRGNLRAAPRRRRDPWLYLHGERWMTRWSRASVVSPSAAVAAYAVEHVGLAAARVHVVPNGVDTERFRPVPRRPELEAEPRGLVVAWIGSLEPVKGLDLLVDALGRTERVRVLLAGDGLWREHLVRRVAQAGLQERVELLGQVSDPRQVLSRADAFLLTSLAESCPMVLLQAMASGLPAVATSVGGVPEVLRHEREGLLVPAGDPDAVAAALRTLRDDPTRRRVLGTAARERILAQYTLDGCLDSLERVYAGGRPCGC